MNHNSDDRQRSDREPASPPQGNDVPQLTGDRVPEFEANAAWATEITQRLRDLDVGLVTMIP